MINEQIRDKEVRLIGENGEQLGVMSARDALKLAREAFSGTVFIPLRIIRKNSIGGNYPDLHSGLSVCRIHFREKDGNTEVFVGTAGGGTLFYDSAVRFPGIGAGSCRDFGKSDHGIFYLCRKRYARRYDRVTVQSRTLPKSVRTCKLGQEGICPSPKAIWNGQIP